MRLILTLTAIILLLVSCDKKISNIQINSDCYIDVVGDCQIVSNGVAYAIQRKSDKKFYSEDVRIWSKDPILAIVFDDSCSAKYHWEIIMLARRRHSGKFKPISQ